MPLNPMRNSAVKLRLKTALYGINYHTDHIMPYIARSQLLLPKNPVKCKISHLYQNRPRDTLWYSMSHSMISSYKSVVRSWALGRSRVAFRKAMEARGYDRDGRAISSFAREPQEAKHIDGLRGTLNVIIQEPVLNAKSSEIERDMDLIVHEVIQTMLKDPNVKKGKVPPPGRPRVSAYYPRRR
ncbi:uncharacterized protein BO97DRAFT_110648 [Aspergillus homomorphus CBS 101889]|uniref:Uncharacterized protein n=1 Tax=Aspergillus homomorphus (strain CBS 101889) TaxID=1450537 RepID=A0A395HSV0_ASPHC|nr:hypothetical protein BO97DRAFT_110648 [Aspergillus homomorphus CBS 101889]RAL11022.1 hypothetical protein BO97DRAFT_110648 [Aspergillus homomorphus CBS 101889]